MPSKNHVLTVLVENKAGVLNRIANLFRRRRFNIESLTVGHSECPGLSRMTIVVDGSSNISQIKRQMYKIIEVIKIKELDESESIIQDFALIIARFTPHFSSFIKKHQGIKVLKRNKQSWVIRIDGTPEEIDSLLLEAKKFNLLQISRTGAIAVSIS